MSAMNEQCLITLLKSTNEKTNDRIAHIWYINILTWLQGFQDQLLLFGGVFFVSIWELRDERNFKKLQFWPESLGAMLEYWYIERGLYKQ